MLALSLTSFAFLRLFLLIFARCVGACFTVPFFSGVETPKAFRFVFALTLSLLVFPTLVASPQVLTSATFFFSAQAMLELVASLCVELFLGATIGLSLKIFFSALYLAGEVVARVGGFSVVGAFDPSVGEEVASVSRFYFWCAAAIFTLCGGLEAFVDGFLTIFTSVVPGSVFDSHSILESFISTLSTSFLLGLKICAPVVITSGALYLGFAFAGRLAAQLNLTTTSFSANSLLALFTMLATFGVFSVVFQQETREFLNRLFVMISPN